MTNFSDFTIGRLSLGDMLIILFYLILCLVIGVRKSSNIKNIKEYALGQGGITTGALVMTLYATYLGAGIMFGSIEWVSAIGMLFAVVVLLKPLQWFVSMKIFGRNIEQFQECITSGDIMARLYGKWGKRISTSAYIMEAIGTVSAQAAALGFLLHYFVGMPLATGIIIGFIPVIFYSVVGGVRAVILTDTLQFGIFYIIIPLICITLLYKLGGWGNMAALVPEEKWEINFRKEGHLSMFLGALFYSVLAIASGPFIQRFLISMNSRQLIRAFKIVTIIDFTVAIMLCLLGFVVASQVGGTTANTEMIWHILSNNLSFIIKGLLAIGVAAIVMSTADSYLNNASVLIIQDILKPLYSKTSDSFELALARFATLLLGILAILLALKGDGILPLVWIGISFSHPLITIPLCAGFLGFRTNSYSFITSVILAAIGVLAGAYLQGKFDVLGAVLGFIGSAIGLFSTHYFQKARGSLTNVAEEEKSWLEERKARGLPPTSSR